MSLWILPDPIDPLRIWKTAFWETYWNCGPETRWTPPNEGEMKKVMERFDIDGSGDCVSPGGVVRSWKRILSQQLPNTLWVQRLLRQSWVPADAILEVSTLVCQLLIQYWRENISISRTGSDAPIPWTNITNLWEFCSMMGFDVCFIPDEKGAIVDGNDEDAASMVA